MVQVMNSLLDSIKFILFLYMIKKIWKSIQNQSNIEE